MAQASNARLSDFCQRRGIKLPPLITTFPNEMPKQLVSRYESGLYGTHRHPLSGGRESLRLSSSSSSRSMEATAKNTGHDANKAVERKSDMDETATKSVHNSNDLKSGFDSNETAEQRLERWRQFYSERSVDWLSDKDDYEEYLDDLLFDRLYNEVQYTLLETGQSNFRGLQHVRFFWDDIRRQLRDQESPVLEWLPTWEQQYCADGHFERQVDQKKHTKAVPVKKRTTDGRDPELLKLREFLKEKPRQMWKQH